MTSGWKHHSIALATSVMVFLATTGIPMPSGFEIADEDFPCRYHGCGCLSAEMCRTQCCCVKPAPTAKGCCSRPAPLANRDADAEETTDNSPSFVVTIRALECKGVAGTLVLGGIIMFPPRIEAIDLSPVACGASPTVVDNRLTSLTELQPPQPPPRA